MMQTRPTSPDDRSLIPPCLRHLRRLTRSFIRDGERISYVCVYARPRSSDPEAPLELIPARETGIEGIACVDDAARAAILALQVHEETGSNGALDLARAWLRFVTYMQQPDGSFANFILDETGTQNLDGATSRPGGHWWTSRALWALAVAWRMTGDERYLRHWQRGWLDPSPELKIKAVQALTLMEVYQAQPDRPTGARIAALCDAIASGMDYFRDRAGEMSVAMWGYHQLQAVARAGSLFGRRDYVMACERTVRSLVEPVVADGFYHVYPHQRDLQCAYSVSTLVLGLEELYGVTHKVAYRNLALECAAWLRGKNPSGRTLYDARTGRCFDGVHGTVASPHCGAESAIEAGFIELARRRLMRMQTRRASAIALAASAVAALSS